MTHKEVMQAIESKIAEYEELIATGQNAGNNVEGFQMGCIVGLSMALAQIGQFDPGRDAEERGCKLVFK